MQIFYILSIENIFVSQSDFDSTLTLSQSDKAEFAAYAIILVEFKKFL